MFALFVGLGLMGCAQTNRSEPPPVRQELDQKLSSEVSLQADREFLKEAREQLPAETKKANDELAFDLEQLTVVKEHPSRLSSKFQDKVRKIHERFRSQSAKVREEYNRDERRRRDAFQKKSQRERDEFKKRKVDRAATKEFYDEQERDRRDFYAAERERRNEFDSEMRLRSKDFNDSVKERSDQFRAQLREYTQRYHQEKTSSPSSPASRPSSALQKEFEEMRKIPATPLGTVGSEEN